MKAIKNKNNMKTRSKDMTKSKYILRMDNGLISKGERCRDEPRFQYLKGLGNSVDFITTDKNQAQVFDEKDIPNDGLKVHTRGWEFIKI